MLLRRISEHVKAQNWTAVALDFVIVVVGVFIGIQVSNWNQERADRRDEDDTLLALHDEITRAGTVNFRSLNYRLSYAEGISEAVNVLFGHLPDRALTDDECTALMGSNIIYMGRADLPSLTALHSSGRIDIIRDEALQRSLAALLQQREAMDFAMQIEQYQYDLPHLYPEAISVVSILEESDRRPDLERTSRATCEINAIRQNQRFMNDIAFNADGYDAFMRDGLRPWVAQFDDTHRQLDIYLNIKHESQTDSP